MQYLVSHFVFFIGDIIHSKNSAWKLYLMLYKIVNTSMLEFLTNYIIELFDILMSKYLKIYLKFLNVLLK